MATQVPPADPFYVNMAKKREMLKNRPVPPASPPILPVPPGGVTGADNGQAGGVGTMNQQGSTDLPGAAGGFTGVLGGMAANTGVIPRPRGAPPFAPPIGGAVQPPIGGSDVLGGGVLQSDAGPAGRPPVPGGGGVLGGGVMQAPPIGGMDATAERRKGQRQFFARRQPQIAPPMTPSIMGGAYT